MGDRPGAPEPIATPSPHPSIVSGDVEPTQDPSPNGSVEEPEHPNEGSGDWGFFREFGFLTLAALLIAILIKTFLIQAFFIPSGSMEPTLMPNDRILVNRLAYRFGDIERGDIIVFADPTPSEQDRGVLGSFVHWLGEGIGVARPADDDFIKRVIALPGETWEMRDGVTYIDGRKLDEPYVNQADLDTRSFGPETVPDGMLFVMGDNRNHSGDSRFPPPGGLGYIPIDRVIGPSVRDHLAPVPGRMAALKADLDRYERALREQGFTRIAGVDEAGRGALAGPLVAAAVILPEDFDREGIDDSKVLTRLQREAAYERIVDGAVAYAVRKIEPDVIDARGLHRSNIALMRRCVNALDVSPDYVLTDGFPVPRMPCLSLGIKKGDAVSASVSAAGIVAKVTRDALMRRLHRRYVEFGFDHNKGYGTPEHWEVLDRLGPTPIHRLSFAGVGQSSLPGFGRDDVVRA